jgi:anthranilate synthase component 1
MRLNTFPDRDGFKDLASTCNVIPVGMTVLADAETPVSVLGRFVHGAESLFLFESADGGERWGRYSFMGVSARVRVAVFRDEVVIREGMHEQRLPHGGDPLSVLRRVLSEYRLAALPGMPRFCGGLVGYMAYEMAHFFESRVPNRVPAEQPLADFMIPENLLVFDNVRHTLTVLALAFVKPGDDLDRAYDAGRAAADRLLAMIEKPDSRPAPAVREAGDLVPRATITKEAFCSQVTKIKEHILEGDVIQAVLSQNFVCEAPQDLFGLYRAQRFINPSPYLYFMKLGGRALIGSSPETMVRLDHRTACLRPIAGTRPRGATEQEDRTLADDLLKDEKERAEHLMLVDLGRNELGRVAVPGTVQVTDLMIVERYSHVMHLVSNIVAELEPGHDAFDLLRSGFPAGTLTGAPKVRAMEIIAGLEHEPRGPYGGAVGYVGFDGGMDFAICIRTAFVEHGRLTLRAGAGIVADSDPQTEWQETVNKARAVARALELLKTAGTPAESKGA